MDEEVDDDVSGAFERRSAGAKLRASRSEKAVAKLCEGDDLGVTFGGVGQERGELGGDVLGTESVLEELGDDASAGDEIGHGDGQVASGVVHIGELIGVADEAFREGKGEGRDPVDDDEGISHN